LNIVAQCLGLSLHFVQAVLDHVADRDDADHLILFNVKASIRTSISSRFANSDRKRQSEAATSGFFSIPPVSHSGVDMGKTPDRQIELEPDARARFEGAVGRGGQRRSRRVNASGRRASEGSPMQSGNA
jgi:hypothetical protein